MSDSTASPSKIKRYIVKEIWKDYEVILEVNHDRLTVEVATMINSFWSNHQCRINAENGDVVKAVIRMFGQVMINMMLSEGGCCFSPGSKHHLFDNPGPVWTADLHNEEGWGGKIKGDAYGWCGIQVIGADVEAPSFDDVDLVEVAA